MKPHQQDYWWSRCKRYS